MGDETFGEVGHVTDDHGDKVGVAQFGDLVAVDMTDECLFTRAQARELARLLLAAADGAARYPWTPTPEASHE